MGQVMVARSVGPGGVGRTVALKRILPELCADKDLVHQFLDEARVGLRLSHPNLVSVYDFGEVGGAYYLAMELVRGVDLGRVLDSAVGALPLPLAAAVMVQSLAGLEAAHSLRAEDGGALNLVHRDLSPSNLMVGFDGHVKVLDFGVAKMRLQRTVTLPGVVKGKALYMSPEQAVGDPVDARSDIFAMGLVLYEALTRVQPFWRETEEATMQAIVSEDFKRHPLIPDTIWPVIQMALSKDREQRYASAAEMAEAIRWAVIPAETAELGRLMAVHFPEKLRELRGWDVTEKVGDVARAKTRVGKAVS
jgi:serine/threonine-protein kinase